MSKSAGVQGAAASWYKNKNNLTDKIIINTHSLAHKTFGYSQHNTTLNAYFQSSEHVLS